MENKIDATLSTAVRDQILDLLAQIFVLLPFLQDLSPDDRQSLIKMGDKSRAFVEGSLTLAEADDSFLPRSFDVKEMRQDKDFHDNLSPIAVQILRLYEGIEDTMMLVGSDLVMNGLEVYNNAKTNGKGDHLDMLVPILGRRFARKSKEEKENEAKNAISEDKNDSSDGDSE